MLWVGKPLQKFQACLYPQNAGYYLCPCLINLEALSTLAFLSLGFLTGVLGWMSPVFIAVDRRRITGPLQIELDKIQIRWGTGRCQWEHRDEGQLRHRGKVRASMGCVGTSWVARVTGLFIHHCVNYVETGEYPRGLGKPAHSTPSLPPHKTELKVMPMLQSIFWHRWNTRRWVFPLPLL